MYKVLDHFYDLDDGGYAYHKGDTYPRKGYRATKDRLAELSSKKNKMGKQLIREVKKNADRSMPIPEELV